MHGCLKGTAALDKMFEHGLGVSRQFGMAFGLYQLAHERGDHRATARLGIKYEWGRCHEPPSSASGCQRKETCRTRGNRGETRDPMSSAPEQRLASATVPTTTRYKKSWSKNQRARREPSASRPRGLPLHCVGPGASNKQCTHSYGILTKSKQY